MSYQTIRYELADEVATIALGRPDKMNSLNRAMRLELTDALGRAGHEARAVVLTGSGHAFCAGQDLSDGGNAASIDLERTLAEEYEPLLRLIYDCPVPTIAAVNGVAAGAGANIALAADLVIAARSASFIEAFARIGLIPDAGGTFWLPRLVGHARAMGLCLLAEPIEAERAAEWGMIWEVVEDDLLEARVRQIATRLASGPTVAYRLMKQALRRSAQNTLDDQLALEAELQGEAGRTRDFAEGVMAFLEKRPAKFEGR
ncbi:2-(1,2-epoxy-1,2-dihydrophenyl)acetyl-CoA isomerase [Limibaculum sp. M0105]|uniref:2-(1,2-epoxy-1,2-dihydrophenyl)acetyl-CoA isomerase n=1 Tax=Thermohalobaculum xanthum TaxID=2753746 RepID=A0A8J7SEE9_9RHOB|nr:enoyl-CoA hydratase-related protein [Thermohalobaculum xanthum]MBK0400622.1 2-(1,2-epoxy-1,2-dihydrophenyl)acetyl-CoA isomerase [Thermohalobaculum xanthum]